MDIDMSRLQNGLKDTVLTQSAIFSSWHPKSYQCPRDFAPPPRDLAPSGAKSLGISPSALLPLEISPPPSPSPPPNDTFQRIFLYLDLAAKKASKTWFGNLFDNGFTRVRLRANGVWSFSKVGVDFLVIVYVNIALQLRA